MPEEGPVGEADCPQIHRAVLTFDGDREELRRDTPQTRMDTGSIFQDM